MSGAWVRLLFALGLVASTTSAEAQLKNSSTKFALPGSPESASAGSKVAGARRRSGPRADAAIATFPGFRILPEGRSRIYVELTKSVTVDERRADGMLVYVIRDARVPVRNNRNALVTTHFNTPVGRARLLAAGPDLELTIDLRKAASATQKVVAGESGGARLEIDFPAGDYPPAPGMFEPPAKGRGREGEEPEPGGALPSNLTPAVPGHSASQNPPASPAASTPPPPVSAPPPSAPPQAPTTPPAR